MTTERKTITRAELARLAAANSKDLPSPVECDGKLMRWVGIGWVNEGAPTGKEVLVK